MKFSVFYNFLQHDPTYKNFGLHKIWSGEVERASVVKMNFDGLNNFEYNHYLDNLDIDLLKNKLRYLTKDEKSLINKHNFRTFNTEGLNLNCLSCSLAGIMKLNLETVQRYIKENLESNDPNSEFKANLCLESLKKRKFIKYTTSYKLNSIQDINMYLKTNVLKLKNKHLLLEEIETDESNAHATSLRGHAVVMKFQMAKDNSEPVKLIFDYQYPGFIQPDTPNPCRFQTFIDTTIYKLYYIHVIEVLKQ